MIRKRFHNSDSRRRGATIVTAAVCATMMIGFAALTLDVGYMFNTRAELQRTADAAAMAGTLSLLNENRLKSSEQQLAIVADARAKTASFAAQNEVANADPGVNDADVLIGYLRNPLDPNETMDFSNPARYNAVRSMIRRDEQANGPIDLFFASIFGRNTTTMTSEATAALMDGISGWKVTEDTGNAMLLPITLKDTAWANLLNETVTAGDNYSYNTTTGLVTAGPDGVPEVNLYPGAGVGDLPPGNYGTVNIKPPDNSTAVLSSQIRYGVTAEHLAYFGGELRFGPDGTLDLNGDTGISGGIKDDLEFIKGQPRAIPIFTTVEGNGNNANYTIVGWAGIRIMYVKLTGNPKKVLIQPAIISDDAALVDVATGSSYNVYMPVRLVR